MELGFLPQNTRLLTRVPRVRILPKYTGTKFTVLLRKSNGEVKHLKLNSDIDRTAMIGHSSDRRARNSSGKNAVGGQPWLGSHIRTSTTVTKGQPRQYNHVRTVTSGEPEKVETGKAWNDRGYRAPQRSQKENHDRTVRTVQPKQDNNDRKNYDRRNQITAQYQGPGKLAISAYRYIYNSEVEMW